MPPTGMIVAATHSFVPALILAAAIAIASAIAYIVIARRPIDQARELLVAAQVPMLDDLLALVGGLGVG